MRHKCLLSATKCVLCFSFLAMAGCGGEIKSFDYVIFKSGPGLKDLPKNEAVVWFAQWERDKYTTSNSFGTATAYNGKSYTTATVSSTTTTRSRVSNVAEGHRSALRGFGGVVTNLSPETKPDLIVVGSEGASYKVDSIGAGWIILSALICPPLPIIFLFLPSDIATYTVISLTVTTPDGLLVRSYTLVSRQVASFSITSSVPVGETMKQTMEIFERFWDTIAEDDLSQDVEADPSDVQKSKDMLLLQLD